MQGWLSKQRTGAVAVLSGLVALSACSRGHGHHAAVQVDRATTTTATTAAPTTTTTTVPPTTTTTRARATPTTVRVSRTTRLSAATSAPAAAAARPPTVANGLAVGDSVLEDVQIYAPSTLTSRGIGFNAAVGRQWGSGQAIVASLRARGRLPSIVVVVLGTNGPIGSGDFDAMMLAALGAKRVVFMTVTGPYAANNSVIEAGVARYPQAALANWAALSASHPGWFAPDNVHVGPAGAAALGNLLGSVA
jgi:hypothetical protein